MSDSPALPLRAENNAKFYSRFKWLGLAAIGFALYCVYDGYYNYPDQQARGEAFLAIAEEELSEEQVLEASVEAHGPKDVYLKLKKLLGKDEGLTEAWNAKAEENGWAKAPPEKLRGEGDILGQYVMAVIAGLGAVYFLSTVLRTRNRWIELNNDGIATSWGESFTLDQITAIDKKQWRDKGIARVRYTGATGGKKTFVVDDYKYHRRTTDEILRQIELGAGADKIVNGKPEPDPSAEASEPAPGGQPTA